MILDIRLMTCKFDKYHSCVSQYMCCLPMFGNGNDMIGKCLPICS